VVQKSFTGLAKLGEKLKMLSSSNYDFAKSIFLTGLEKCSHHLSGLL
jgi:hypothetical protein